MLIRMNSIVFILLLFCQQTGDPMPGQNAVSKAATDMRWHYRALLLAGMELPQSYANLPEVQKVISQQVYRNHKYHMNRFWYSVRTNRIQKIGQWHTKSIHDRLEQTSYKTAIYPLSGGDLLNFRLMHPDAKSYIMMAMEKNGAMPAPASLSYSHWKNGLFSIQKMLGNIAMSGYFYSRWMNWYMNPEKHGYYGTLPTLSVFLVRMGNTITGIDKVCINNEAELLSVPLDPAGNGIITAPSSQCELHGYRIHFLDAKSRDQRSVMYFSARITNALFSLRTPTGKFFKNQGPYGVMLKAAVYLYHRPQYKDAADFLLKNSNVVIQDDSGFPYYMLKNGQWDIELYGGYLEPLPGMGVYPQRNLIADFRYPDGYLPFHYGYGQKTRTLRSGIIVAYRK